MTVSLRFFTLCLLVLCIGRPRAAWADDTMDTALATFEKGVSLFNTGKFQAAADTFRKAYDLKPSWKLLFNIGQSEAAAKHYGLALEAFEQFLSEGGDEINEKRRDEVLAEVVRLRKMVGYLKIDAAEGTVIVIDDLKRGTAPMNTLLPFAAGIRHKVRGDVAGETAFSDTYQVVGGQTMNIRMQDAVKPPGPEATVGENNTEPAVSPEPVTAETVVESSGKHPLLIAGWAVASTGAATAIAGGIIGGIALSKNNALAEQCQNTSCPDRTQDESKYHSMANAATALLAAGGAVLATGVALLIVGKIRKNKEMRPVTGAIFTNGSAAGASLFVRF